MAGDPRFKKLLDELWDLHCRKSTDYGIDDDHLANYNDQKLIGEIPWRYTSQRFREKCCRWWTYLRTGKLACEDVEETLLDLAAMPLITLILWREENEYEQPEPVLAEPIAKKRYECGCKGFSPKCVVHGSTEADVWPCGCFKMDGEVGSCSQHGPSRK